MLTDKSYVMLLANVGNMGMFRCNGSWKLLRLKMTSFLLHSTAVTVLRVLMVGHASDVFFLYLHLSPCLCVCECVCLSVYFLVCIFYYFFCICLCVCFCDWRWRLLIILRVRNRRGSRAPRCLQDKNQENVPWKWCRKLWAFLFKVTIIHFKVTFQLSEEKCMNL